MSVGVILPCPLPCSFHTQQLAEEGAASQLQSHILTAHTAHIRRYLVPNPACSLNSCFNRGKVRLCQGRKSS